MNNETVRLQIRFPKDLSDKLDLIVQKERRTKNATIIIAFEEYIKNHFENDRDLLDH